MLAFEEAKLIGGESEKRVADAMFSAGWFVQRRHALHKRDLAVLTPGGIELIEVKNEDAYATRSKNICIELLQGRPRKPSGILISESTVCIHTFCENCLLYRTQPMRLYLQSLPELKMMDFGDNNNAGAILPRMSHHRTFVGRVGAG